MSLSNRQPALVVTGGLVVALAGGLAWAQAWELLAGYVLLLAGPSHVVLYPYRRCRFCEGGRVWNRSHTNWANCAVCGGAGRRLRWWGMGARIRGALGIPT